jgi:hypothetical protein
MGRGGWLFGVWGEDFTRITMSGQTAGQYFEMGLTDEFNYFTKSYRNLQQLMMVFENNGYWFEGEEAGEGPLNSPDFTRRRIKMHQTVQLCVGNFIWSGMFDSLTVRQEATNPFSFNFDISFLAWKEEFRTGSPYTNPLDNHVERGHVYDAGKQQLNDITSQVQALPINGTAGTNSVVGLPPLSGSVIPPAVEAAQAEINFPELSPSACSYVPMGAVFNPSTGGWD